METKIDKIKEIKKCPIEYALEEIDKKWTLHIIKSIYLGSKRFNEILTDYDNLSNKVLADRLKELEKNGIIEKEVKSTTPLLIEYKLTSKGKSLNKVLFELAMFTVENFKEKLNVISKEDIKNRRKVLGDMFLKK
jgi:DNA-binding HxlR family transcriptional regulator